MSFEYQSHAHQLQSLRANELQVFHQLQELHLQISRVPIPERNANMMSDYQQKQMHAQMQSLEEVCSIDMQQRLRNPVHSVPTSSAPQNYAPSSPSVNSGNSGNAYITTWTPPLTSSNVHMYPSMQPVKSKDGVMLGYMDSTGQQLHAEASQPLLTSLLAAGSLARGDVWTLHPARAVPLGLQVAALYEYMDASSGQHGSAWILGRIIGTNEGQGTRLYVIQDEDLAHPAHPSVVSLHGKPPSDTVPLKTYSMPADNIIPLPAFAEFSVDRRLTFAPGTTVYALYPVDGCTTFYQARVVKTPSQLKKPVYLVRFDEEDENRLVHTKFIFPMKMNTIK